MKYQILLVILSLCISFSVANRNWGLVIDDFSTTNRDLLIALKNIDVFPYIAHTSIISDTILGTERDHILRALAGTNGKMVSHVVDGKWNITVPDGARALAIMQYDGTDSGLRAIDPTGLGGFDFTDNGADAITVVAFSTKTSRMTINVYDMFGGFSSAVFHVDSKNTKAYIANFSAFSGNVDFTSVGAIEFRLLVTGKSNAGITKIGTTGPGN